MFKKEVHLKSILSLFLLFTSIINAQNYTSLDSIRGSITKERAWWNLLHYNLEVSVFPESKSIKGKNTITYQVLQPHRVLQIDLQQPLIIDSIVQNNEKLDYTQKKFAYFINLKEEQIINTEKQITIYYHGAPKEAKKAPWDGGFVWTKDAHKKPWISTANQSIGPSIWWPCKDHPADEVDHGMQISVTCPDYLMNVSNGKLIKNLSNNNGTKTFTWAVKNPINAYSICINIGNYINFHENFKGEKGDLFCSYFILNGNFLKAKKQFKQVSKTLEAFEYWLGPYPFYEDHFKLVETPYLGMEHQSAVAYGNGFQNGYLGYPMGKSDWGLQFDYIIVHETGHEWFANSITCKDVADLWIHESFTTYVESLYVDYHFGKQAANEYVQGLRDNVSNEEPIQGKYGIRKEGSTDMYFKGSLMLHTLRHSIDDDKLWRKILRGLNEKFYHQTVNAQQVIDYISEQAKIDLSNFFKQYLTTTKIPKLVLKQKGKKILYEWKNVVDDFSLRIKAYINEKPVWITPTTKCQWIEGDLKYFKVDENFYIEIKK